jgi:hypothetical protein
LFYLINIGHSRQYADHWSWRYFNQVGTRCR